MTAWIPGWSSRRRAAISSGGFTLLEVMVALVVSATILVPLLAWTAFGYKEQDATSRRLADDGASNILNNYFARDIQSSSSVTAGGTDCLGGRGAVVAGDPDAAVLVSAVTSDGVYRTTYTVSAPAPGSTTRTLWRRSCKVSPIAGDVTSASPIAKGIAPPTGATIWSDVVACSDRVGRTADTCGQVVLRFNGQSGKTLSVAATKRIGEPWPP